MLADGLCPCLCALPSFAQFCLPLALEKLDSSLRIAKMDSLKLLVEFVHCFKYFSFIFFFYFRKKVVRSLKLPVTKKIQYKYGR